jgi:type I restriction-modification system DNA methylase subunit
VLEGLGPRLKVCDPAMGSGAFLVEACRQQIYQQEGDALALATPPPEV